MHRSAGTAGYVWQFVQRTALQLIKNPEFNCIPNKHLNWWIKMLYYIYRINETLKHELGKINIKSLNNIDSKIIFQDNNSQIIHGLVNLKNDPQVKDFVNFEIDLKYSFLFIQTDYLTFLNKCLQIIEPFFNDNLGGQLENFLPLVSKEKQLISNSKDFNLKFYNDGHIIDCEDDENIKLKYCKSELSKDYSLIEAEIKLKNGISFTYLRKAILIPDENTKKEIFEIFKKTME